MANPSGPITIDVIKDVESLASLAEDWQALHAISPQAAPPLHPDWMLGWLREFGDRYVGNDALRTFVFRDTAGRLVGLLPCYLARERLAGYPARVLRFLSTGEREAEETCPDYLNILAAPDLGTELVSLLAPCLLADSDWDVIDLVELPADSPLLGLAVGAFARLSTVSDRGECPRALVPAGVESLLPHVSAKTRRNTRRMMRDIAAGGMTLDLADDGASIERAFDDLVSLHTARWAQEGLAGAFHSPAFQQMHRHLARKWIPAGAAMLATLRCEGRPLAVIYGFISGNEFHFYQCGVTRERLETIHSPGLAANVALMDVLSRRGIVVYDFLRGAQAYKHDYKSDARALRELRVVRNSRVRAVEFGKRLLRPLRRHVSRPAAKAVDR